MSFTREFLAFLWALFLKMKRRELIKSIGLAAAATSILPDWLQGWSVQKLTPSLIFSEDQKDKLSLIAGTFIPEGAEKGANGVGVGKFLDVLFADCFTAADQNKIKEFLLEIDTLAKLQFQQNFGSKNKGGFDVVIPRDLLDVFELVHFRQRLPVVGKSFFYVRPSNFCSLRHVNG